MEPDDALALDAENIRQWLSGHDRLALPESGPERFRAIPGDGFNHIETIHWTFDRQLAARIYAILPTGKRSFSQITKQ